MSSLYTFNDQINAIFGGKVRQLSLSAGMLPARTDVQHLLIPIYIRPVTVPIKSSAAGFTHSFSQAAQKLTGGNSVSGTWQSAG